MSKEDKSAQKKIKDLVSLLSHNEDFSNVLILQNLFKEISLHTELFRCHFEKILKVESKEIENFRLFIEKAIICFPNIRELERRINYQSFISDISTLNSIRVDSNIKLTSLLAEAISFIAQNERAGDKNYVQMSGVKLDLLGENHTSLLKNYSNRLINTRNFEILRLLIGDQVLLYIFKYSSLFIFDEKALNYIQVLGYSLKEKIAKLLKIPEIQKCTNYLCQKVFTANSFVKEKERTQEEVTNKARIPYQQFNVERTKIFYCPNFNRKLGLFHKLGLKMKNPENENDRKRIAKLLYDKIFGVYEHLVPSYLTETIKAHLSGIVMRLNKFPYHKVLFDCCPLGENSWTKQKSEIEQQIKMISSLSKDQKGSKDALIESLNESLLQFIRGIIEYEKVHKFVCEFIKKVIPHEFLGPHNIKILRKKAYQFISMNRFESFNKSNLFDLKEFSFTGMKWLQLKNMTNETYTEVGILLKNFIMKNIIFWIFDFLIVQLLRSHFYITEKQGDHFKTFYYHKNTWDMILKINEVKFVHMQEQYTPIEKSEAMNILKMNDSAPGRLRLMPKPSSCRPITSFKKRTLGMKNLLKNKLFEAQKIFKLIQNKMQGDEENAVVFDYKKIIQRLISFKNTLNNSLAKELEETMLKYVTMDIEACYDNIDITRLNSFLDKDDTIGDIYVTGILYVLLPRPHVLRRKDRSSVEFKECFDAKILFLVSELSDYLHFLNTLQKREDINYTHCLLYLDSKGITYIGKEEFIPMVRGIVNNNIIKYNRKFFKQIKGIPQGLSVSSFLCNLYFYEIEKNISTFIHRSSHTNLLLRFMDDYLCVSKKSKDTMHFRDTARKLSTANMFKFNMKKSQTNLLLKEYNNNEQGIILQKSNTSNNSDQFNWNGINFELTADSFFSLVYDSRLPQDINAYSKLININLPILKNQKDYTWLIKKINSIFFTGHPWIYFISILNSKRILESNFEKFCKLVAFKIIVLVNKLTGSCLKPSQNGFINILDICLKKTYFYFDSKIEEIEGKRFFLRYDQFFQAFYICVFKAFVTDREYNTKMISLSPFFFSCIKRKLERLKIKRIIFGDETEVEAKLKLEGNEKQYVLPKTTEVPHENEAISNNHSNEMLIDANI